MPRKLSKIPYSNHELWYKHLEFIPNKFFSCGIGIVIGICFTKYMSYKPKTRLNPDEKCW